MNNITQETFIDFVRKYWSPDLTEEECDTILWNLTSFPFSPLEKIEEELIEQHLKSGGNIDLAMDMYHQYITEESKRLREEDRLQ